MTGYCSTCADPTLRSYFVFPIPSFTGTVSSVTLRVQHNRYGSSEAQEMIGFYDVSTSISTLVGGSGGSTTWASVFNDLGTGTQYATTILSSSTLNTMRAVTLNSAGISKVSGLRGSNFAIGASLDSYSGRTGADEWIDFSTLEMPGTHQLQIVVTP